MRPARCSNETAAIIVATTVLLGINAFSGTMPTVTIGGLDGAAHWAWYEGECNFDNDNGNDARAFARYITRASGFNSKLSPVVESLLENPYGNVETVWTVSMPAAMDNAQFYTYSGSYATRPYDILVGGTEVGSFTLQGAGSTLSPDSWTETAIGTLGSGPHTIEVHQGNGTYNSFLVTDGYYITDGELSAFGGLAETTVAGMDTDYRWRQAPTFETIPGVSRPVSATIDIADAVGYTILLNGTPYISGTPITERGTYTLTVEAFGSENQDRILAGATFVVPEPATCGLLLLLLPVWLCLSGRTKPCAVRGQSR
ncbi:MAG: hypothetical protein K9N51_00390 [Candidatus Pacebacteria bacterium]|nr:hypothetical protein [Candidatus Paceibacterota bacterium]